MRRKHLSTIIALGVALAFIVLIGLSICVSDALSASDSDDQCDYIPPPEFDWEGELNPNEFDNWETIDILQTSSPFQFIAIIKNPDETSTIKKIALYMLFDGTFLGYRYFKDGQPYSFGLNSESNKYLEYHLTPKQRNSCMKCHQDKIVPEEAT